MKLCHLVVTTGSAQGVGLEIALKSIQSLKPRTNTRITLLVPKTKQKIAIKSPWKSKKSSLVELSNWRNLDSHHIQVIQTNLSAARVVERAVAHCLKDSDSAMVNAPMRKTKDGGGHTEIIKRMSKAKKLKMAFVGKRFNLCLATTHIPVDQVYKRLTTDVVKDTVDASLKLHELTNREGPIALLGLNPHAGENGSISKQDNEILKKLKSTGKRKRFTQMLPPDGAFIGGTPGKTVLAWYHDQGLIPFKTMHGLSEGIQVTLGIPFIRTSVDHGTAEDLYGQGVADFRSLKMAMEYARKFQLKFGNTLFE